MFGNKLSGLHLLKFSWFKISRHCLVKGTSSPDDPTLKEYWLNREKDKSKNLTKSLEKLALKQDNRYPLCGDSLFNGETLHRHHKIPRHLGGKDTYANLQLVHYYCHQQIHSSQKKSILKEEELPLW